MSFSFFLLYKVKRKLCTIHFTFIRFFHHNMRRGFNGNSMLRKFEGIPYKCRQSTYVHQKFIYAYVQQRRVYVAISYPLRLHFPSIVVRDSIFLVPVSSVFSRARTYRRHIVPIGRNKSEIRSRIFLKNSCSGTYTEAKYLDFRVSHFFILILPPLFKREFERRYV